MLILDKLNHQPNVYKDVFEHKTNNALCKVCATKTRFLRLHNLTRCRFSGQAESSIYLSLFYSVRRNMSFSVKSLAKQESVLTGKIVN